MLFAGGLEPHGSLLSLPGAATSPVDRAAVMMEPGRRRRGFGTFEEDLAYDAVIKRTARS